MLCFSCAVSVVTINVTTRTKMAVWIPVAAHHITLRDWGVQLRIGEPTQETHKHISMTDIISFLWPTWISEFLFLTFVIKWNVPVTTTWSVIRLRGESRVVIRRVDGNTLNKQLRTATRGSLPALVLNDVLTTPHQNANVLQNITEALGLNRSFWMA